MNCPNDRFHDEIQGDGLQNIHKEEGHAESLPWLVRRTFHNSESLRSEDENSPEYSTNTPPLFKEGSMVLQSWTSGLRGKAN